jgi:hypothetical protein
MVFVWDAGDSKEVEFGIFLFGSGHTGIRIRNQMIFYDYYIFLFGDCVGNAIKGDLCEEIVLLVGTNISFYG